MNFERSLSHELRLAIACCQLAFRTPARGHFDRDIDWQRFLAQSRRHRIQGLAHAGIESLGLPAPAPVLARLREDAQAIAQHNLRSASESARLLRAFNRSGVPIMFVKGLTLAALAYRDPYLKMGWDIDALVPFDRLDRSRRLLKRLGYDLITPARMTRLQSWHGRHKESVWRHRQSGLYLELHTRLADHPATIPDIGMRSPAQMVQVAPQVVLPTLGTEELFAYLCVHGASSAWFRLKWVADLAGLLSGLSAVEVETLYRRSQELGAGRCAGQALLLANGLFRTPLPERLEGELLASRTTRWLARAAFSQIAAKREPTERFLGTAAIHWTQLLMHPGLGFAASEIRRQVGAVLR